MGGDGGKEESEKPFFEINSYFLKCCFWDFPSKCNSSNGNQQIWPEKGDNLGRQFFP
jgi:hypothetical protein